MNVEVSRVVLSGLNCTGKTTLANMLEQDPDLRIPRLIAHATRNPRPGESEGHPYHFISREEFEEKRAGNRYFYILDFGNNFYATPWEDIERPKFVMDIIATRWREWSHLPGIVGIYLLPPSDEVRKIRSIGRGETAEAAEKRIKAETFDPAVAAQFHYQVDSSLPVETVYQRVKEIVLKHRTFGSCNPSPDTKNAPPASTPLKPAK